MNQSIQPAAETQSLTPQTRKNYLNQILIEVKKVEKTMDQDQLIAIKCSRRQSREVIGVVIRKLSQLDSLVEHISYTYGGHIIPFIDSDLYFQKGLQMQYLTPIIQNFLNDVKTHFYCQKDIKFYQFLLFQSVQFPQQFAYEKVLSSAATMSRKYLNSVFTRKQNYRDPQHLNEFEVVYKSVNDFQTNYIQIKTIILNYVQQHQTLEDVARNLSQLSGQLAFGVFPSEQLTEKIKKKIKKIDKFLKRVHEAYSRVQILRQTVRQLQGNIYKGLHQDSKLLQIKEKLLKKWTQSLSIEFDLFIQQASQICRRISQQIYEIKKGQVNEFNVNLQLLDEKQSDDHNEQHMGVSPQKINPLSTEDQF